MKKKPLITSLLVSCALSSFAQVQENETKTFNNDFGFNTTFILQNVFQSSSTPFTVMYKKYQSDKKALRFGIGGSLSSNNNEDKTINSSYSNNSNWRAEASFGKEFQKHISQKWFWYSGGDVFTFYSVNDNDSFNNSIKTYTSKSSNYGLGLRPFVGIRFNINKQLYLSAEASLRLVYSRNTDYSKNLDADIVSSDKKGSTVTASLNPASGLFLFYRF